jgi:hypothetical protein
MNPIIAPLAEEVTEATTVMESATILISGFQERINTAVAQALANGATEAELAPFVALEATLEANRVALAAAVAANTPGA